VTSRDPRAWQGYAAPRSAGDRPRPGARGNRGSEPPLPAEPGTPSPEGTAAG